jgi:hypothetical protein
MDALLCSLVRAGRFSAAERLRLKIVAGGSAVSPEREYADVALACLRNRRLTGARGLKLAEFQTWMELVPDRERISGVPPPFDAVVAELVDRASIPKFAPFFVQTALIVADKGYAPRHFLALARPMTLHGFPDALLHIERHAVHYEQLNHLPPTLVARFIRTSLIQLFLERGWPRRSLDLLLAPRTYTLPDEIYKLVLDALPRKRNVILKNREKDKTITTAIAP